GVGPRAGGRRVSQTDAGRGCEGFRGRAEFGPPWTGAPERLGQVGGSLWARNTGWGARTEPERGSIDPVPVDDSSVLKKSKESLRSSRMRLPTIRLLSSSLTGMGSGYSCRSSIVAIEKQW